MLVPKQIEYLDQQYSTDSNPSVEKMRVMSEECGATFEQVQEYFNQDSCSTVNSDAPSDQEDVTLKLNELLAPGNSLLLPSQILPFSKLMHLQKSESNKLLMLNAILNTPTSPVLSLFAQSKGVRILRFWLHDSSKSTGSLMLPILNVLDYIPLSLETIKNESLGKIVKILAKGELPSVSPTSCQKSTHLIQKWKNLIDTQVVVENDKKRPSVPDIATKRPRRADPKPKAAAEPPPQPASFQIFQTMSAIALPKIKKGEQAPPDRKRKSNSLLNSVKIQKTESPTVEQTSPVMSTTDSLQDSTPPVISYRKSESTEDLAPEESQELATQAAKKPKKSVQFKPDDRLTQIRLFDSSDVVTPSMAEDQIASEVKLIQWRLPPKISFGKDPRVLGAQSKEALIQEEREKRVLSQTYFRDEDIPFSPAEPDIDNFDVPDDSRLTIIPPPSDHQLPTSNLPQFTPPTANLANLIMQLQNVPIENNQNVALNEQQILGLGALLGNNTVAQPPSWQIPAINNQPPNWQNPGMPSWPNPIQQPVWNNGGIQNQQPNFQMQPPNWPANPANRPPRQTPNLQVSSGHGIPKKRGECKFFKVGQCHLGAGCRFSHQQ